MYHAETPGDEQAIIFPVSHLRVQRHAPRHILDYPRTSQQGSSHPYYIAKKRRTSMRKSYHNSPLIWKLRNPLKNLRGYTSNSKKLCCFHGEVPTQTEQQNCQSHWDARLEALAKERDKIFRKLKKSRQDCRGLWSTFHAFGQTDQEKCSQQEKSIRRQKLNAMVRKSVPETHK